MGFYPQPNEWTCGPFALRHALIALGLFVSEERITKLCRTHWWAGTSEPNLASAARTLGVDTALVRRRDRSVARRELYRRLRQRIPALLCVDDWEHWVAALAADTSHVVIVDSNLSPVIQVLSWSQLISRWGYEDVDYDEDDPPVLYDFLELSPRRKTPMRADFSMRRIRYLARPSNADLAQHWDAYLSDLTAMCRPRSRKLRRVVSVAEFLRRNEPLIIGRVTYWHGAITPARVRLLLRRMQFVADTYGLVIHADGARQAVVDMTILATMWANVHDPVESLYGVGAA